MASLPLASWPAQPTSASPAPPRLYAVEAPPQFSDLEWSVVAMGERDSLASLRAPSRFWSLVSAIFGIKPANRLANDRLEALRRVSVLAWRYRWNVPQSELKAFFAAGYSPAHFDQLVCRIAVIRSRLARGRAR